MERARHDGENAAPIAVKRGACAADRQIRNGVDVDRRGPVLRLRKLVAQHLQERGDGLVRDVRAIDEPCPAFTARGFIGYRRIVGRRKDRKITPLPARLFDGPATLLPFPIGLLAVAPQAFPERVRALGAFAFMNRSCGRAETERPPSPPAARVTTARQDRRLSSRRSRLSRRSAQAHRRLAVCSRAGFGTSRGAPGECAGLASG